MDHDKEDEVGLEADPDDQDGGEPDRPYWPPPLVGISSVSGTSPGAIGISPLLFEPEPVEEGDSEETIPSALLLALKDRMHSRRSCKPGEPGYVHRRLGVADQAIFLIDDGKDHCMVGRLVGETPDGCAYCLVARVSVYRCEQLADGDVPLTDAFSDAHDLSLCGVFEEEQGFSNVLLVQHYRSVDGVPPDYLPPSPFLEFTDESSPNGR
ncbi:MAG: hypothetical protein ABSC00_09025 [Acidimicrobiales bacterium]